MKAAVPDHGGGEASQRGMAMSQDSEIAPLLNAAGLGAAAEGIEQQTAVPALHQHEAEADEPHGPIAKVMGLPAAVRHAAAAEEGFGDVAIAGVFEPAVERAQRQDQALAARRRQFRRVSAWRSSAETAPEADRRCGADLEEPIER